VATVMPAGGDGGRAGGTSAGQGQYRGHGGRQAQADQEAESLPAHESPKVDDALFLVFAVTCGFA
jgi:hypothetical protein